MGERRQYESLKYPFNADELRELGEELARVTQIIIDLEDSKSTSNAKINAEIKTANAQRAELAQKINNQYELRAVEVLVLMDTPRPGMKRLIRADNTEFVRDEAMSLQEMQSSFGFAEGDDRND